MIPIALRITNFRSVLGTQSFIFPREPGLYFLQGINELEPRLEANGSGKTTIWEALTWCWFGKTSRGLKAGEVCNWGVEKGVAVEFDFQLREDDPCVWTMRRTWGPISWTLSHIAEYITDEEVVDLTKEKDNPAFAWLALDFDCWLSCVLMAQRAGMFLDLKRDAQAALFSSVMGADSWLDYSAGASKRAADEDRKLRDLERELANLEGSLETTGRQDYREEAKGWEAGHKRKLDDLEEQHTAQLKKRKMQKQELANAIDREEKARREWGGAQAPSSVALRIEELRNALATGEREHAKAELRADELAKTIARLQGSSRCPVCGQEMNANHRQIELAAARRSKDALEAELDGLDEAVKQGARALDLAENSLNEVREQRKEAERALDDAERNTASARRALDLLDRELDRLEEEHETAQRERNPYADMEDRARQDAQRLRRDIERTQARIDATAERHSLFQFWVRGFKDIRLVKIDESLTELEIEVNSGVDALGLLGWELQFQVDRETKSGKMERGFNCYVRSPTNDRQVPWEAWSGGESQRLRLAGNMGLADLIRSRVGASIPLEVWDEPTEGLSPQGTRDLLECLQERAQREQRCIWIVDHRSHDFGGFAGVTVIRKTARGTIIENGIDKA